MLGRNRKTNRNGIYTMNKAEKIFAHRFFRIMREIEASRRRTFRREVGMTRREYEQRKLVTISLQTQKSLANECIHFQS